MVIKVSVQDVRNRRIPEGGHTCSQPHPRVTAVTAPFCIEVRENETTRTPLLPNQATMETMVDAADRSLLRAVVIRDRHVLRRLFLPIPATQYNLRPRSIT